MKVHTRTGSGELIWQGRIQIGDEPGVYGDANYSGLAAEFPITLTAFGSGTPTVEFELSAEGASNFGPPYKGHNVTLFALTESNPAVWQKAMIAQGQLTSDSFKLAAPLPAGVRYVSLRVEADTSVTPGFYDDFVLTGLTLHAASHYADFGFRA
ncbi:hypothetical protein GIW81_14775 [Hyphomicrobium sp. xq]|uniref:Uncharacterized protein n=1 Tax=Hyphomicrobium album TaxID=2665159 RepID=A0A6I3KNV1_9HYPH|nr:hypothetical protein [Hyphomicrobium album]MTD95600.1 hypothetical protein [Hyphomicrobium album]